MKEPRAKDKRLKALKKAERAILHHLRPTDLIHTAREFVEAQGHQLGHFVGNANETWFARCQLCHAGVSVIPVQIDRDGRGFGGKALSPCPGPSAPAFDLSSKGGKDNAKQENSTPEIGSRWLVARQTADAPKRRREGPTKEGPTKEGPTKEGPTKGQEARGKSPGIRRRSLRPER